MVLGVIRFEFLSTYPMILTNYRRTRHIRAEIGAKHAKLRHCTIFPAAVTVVVDIMRYKSSRKISNRFSKNCGYLYLVERIFPFVILSGHSTPQIRFKIITAATVFSSR